MISHDMNTLLAHGRLLEAARRAEPLDAKGFSLNWEEANEKYQEWLLMHGMLLIEAAEKNQLI